MRQPAGDGDGGAGEPGVRRGLGLRLRQGAGRVRAARPRHARPRGLRRVARQDAPKQWTPGRRRPGVQGPGLRRAAARGQEHRRVVRQGQEGPRPPLRPLGLPAVRRPRSRPGQPLPAGHGRQRRRERRRGPARGRPVPLGQEAGRGRRHRAPRSRGLRRAQQLARRSSDDTWGLGSQHWAKNPAPARLHGPLRHPARHGRRGRGRLPAGGDVALLRPGRRRRRSGTRPGRSGTRSYFVDRESGTLIDDHLYINQYAGIPTADIIDYDDRRNNGFPDSWHTVGDTLDKIDRNTLAAVGKTVLAVVYGEK
ncbi:MAG: M28 family peptidase [Candidatus Moduliflexus flocculans]|nr:M28 family peptidase [Candidatus Moduliflexus flocculans]